MYLSEVVSKRVVSLKSATAEGMVIGAYVNMRNYQDVYLMLDSGKIMREEDIFSLGEVITVTDKLERAIQEDDYFKLSPTQEIILASGERLGRLKNILLWGRGKKGEIEADKGNIKLKTVVAVSDNIITANPTYRVLSKAPKIPTESVLSISGKTDESQNESDLRPLSPPTYDFLIGKKVSSEVSDISRSFVLMAGTLITERVIENARRAGKLSDLVNKSK
ncbi:MAG: hypothetical protein IJ033_04215 [Clostridia bacterium]|nr:hypothetical protein [Clostridia bacterium]